MNVSYVIGMGSSQLRNHNGSTRVMIYVQYVRKLKKNIISFSALESNGLVIII